MTPPLAFKPRAAVANDTGDLLAVAGHVEIAVLQLPASSRRVANPAAAGVAATCMYGGAHGAARRKHVGLLTTSAGPCRGRSRGPARFPWPTWSRGWKCYSYAGTRCRRRRPTWPYSPPTRACGRRSTRASEAALSGTADGVRTKPHARTTVGSPQDVRCADAACAGRAGTPARARPAAAANTPAGRYARRSHLQRRMRREPA